MLNYFYCPSYIVTMLKGKPHTLVVLINLILHRSIETNNTYFISIPSFAKLSGISRRETYNAIDKLKDLNLIEEVANRRGERMFHLPFLATDNNTAENDVSGETITENNVSIPDNPTAAEIKAMSSAELEALWDREYGTNGGPQIGNQTG